MRNVIIQSKMLGKRFGWQDECILGDVTSKAYNETMEWYTQHGRHAHHRVIIVVAEREPICQKTK